MRVTLTTAGQALLDANQGPVTVTSFQLGSAYGYIPQPSDTGIHGTLIYTGVPSAPIVANANVVKYSMYLDYNLGPFNFGEVGLFVGTTLFALATGDELIAKIAISAGSMGNAIRIDEYLSIVSTNYEMWLDLSTSNSQFQMAILGSVDQLPPSAQAIPNAYIISGASGSQSAFQAYTDKNALWNFDAYQYANQVSATITGFTNQSITIALSQYVTEMTPEYFGQVILQFSSGTLYSICRYVQSTVASGSSVTLNFFSQLLQNPIVGDTVVVFARQALSTTIPTLPVATHSTLGAVIVGTTLTVDPTGLINVAPSAIPVVSVNGQTGAVVLTAANISGFAAVAYSGNYSDLNGVPTPYTLPIATTSIVGGVKAPSDSNLTVAGDGTIDLGFSPVKKVNGVSPDGTGNVTVSIANVGLVNPAQITNGSDLNTFKTTGLFFVLNADSPSLLNGPGASGGRPGAVVEVIPYTTTATGGDVIQRWNDNVNMYYRRYTQSSNTWSTWVQLATATAAAIATTSSLGVVQIGAGLNITGGGTLSTVIQSVNGKSVTNVVLGASDVSAVPAASVGNQGGVALLDSGSVNPSTDPFTFGRMVFYENTLGTWQNMGKWDANANHLIQAHTGNVTTDTNTSLQANGQQTIDISYNGLGLPGLTNPDYQTVNGEGFVYQVTVAGSTSLDGIASWSVGDLAVAVNGKWVKIIARQLLVGDVSGAAPLASPALTGTPTAPTATFGTNTTQIASTAFVQAAVTAGTAGVTTFNTRNGAVTLLGSDITSAGGALLASPTFTGVPAAPTASPGTNTTQVATTAFVTAAVAAATTGVSSFNTRTGAVTLQASDVTGVGGALLASPTFTGVPAAPTATSGTNTTQLATTAFVTSAVSAAVVSFNTRTGAVTLQAADVTGVGGALLASPTFTGVPAAPTATAGTNTTQLATTAFVTSAVTTAVGAAVTSFNTRTGAVTLQLTDVTGVGGAPIASPAFTGTPTAPTPTAGDNSVKVATTAFVATSYAPLASPALTGTPTSTTATAGTNTTQIATTAFVTAAVGAAVVSFNTRTGAVTLQLSDVTGVGGAPIANPAFTGVPTAATAAPGTSTTQLATTAFVAVSYAPLASPSLTGTPVAPTATFGTNTTQLATTAFVQAAVTSAVGGAVTSFNTRTGAVTLQASDVTGVGGALLASPTFTGVPAAPTATAGTNTTQLATTAFVTAAVATGVAGAVTSFNTRTGAVTLQASDVTGVGGALLASPTFTGTPSGPTATAGTNTTQLATTAFVVASYAPLASPALTGVPTAPTATAGTNTTQIATTAFVATSYAPLASPALTGTPTTPTAAVSTNTTQIASTAFVQAAITNLQTGKVNGVNLPNLLFNGSAEFGTLGWQSPVFQATTDTLGDGTFFNNAGTISSTTNDTSQQIPMSAGVALVLAGDIYAGGLTAGHAYIWVEAYTASNASLGNIGSSSAFPSPGAGWTHVVASGTTPSTTAYVLVHKTVDSSPAVSAGGLGYRRLKLEQGTSPSLYSAEPDFVYLAASPAFTGNPTALTAAQLDSSTKLATTAFVQRALGNMQTSAQITGATALTVANVGTAYQFVGAFTATLPQLSTVPPGAAFFFANNTNNVATVQRFNSSDPQITVGQTVGASVSVGYGDSLLIAEVGGIWLAFAGSLAAANSAALISTYAKLASPALTGTPTAPTATSGTNTTQLATTAFVTTAVSGAVVSFNTRTGAVTLQASDVTGVGGALLASPTFTGVPAAPTATAGTNTTQLATTAFVTAAVAAAGGVISFNTRTGAVTLQASDVTGVGGALLASPTFTGVPAAPTATAGTNTTQIATTAFVAASYAPLASPALTGVPTAPTATAGTNTTQLATTAFVTTAVGGAVTSFNTRTGAVTLGSSDITGAGGALLASPTFTGVPAGPTATAGTSTTQLATTAFVATSFAPLASPTFTGTPAAPTATAGTNTTQVATTAFVTTAVNAVTTGYVLAANLAATSGTQGAALVGYNPNTTNTVNRTVYVRLKDLYTLKDFGATGNGSTDDTTSILNAANSGIPIWVPPGLYQMSNVALSSLSSTTFMGMGDFYNCQFRITGTGFGFQLASSTNVRFENITITSTGGASQGGISVDTHSNIKLKNCLIYNFQGPGVQMNGTSGTPISGCVIQDSFLLGCGLNGTAPQLYATYSNDFMYTNNQIGSLTPTVLSTSPAEGVHLVSSSNGYFADNLIWSSQFQGMTMDTGCSFNRIHANRFEQSGQQGLWVINSSQNIFTSNWLNDNSVQTANTYDQMIIDGSTFNIISNNYAFASAQSIGRKARYNYNFQNTSTNNTFTHNKSQYAGTEDIFLSSTSSLSNTWDSTIAMTLTTTALPANTTLYLNSTGVATTQIPQFNNGSKVIVGIKIQSTSAPGTSQSYTASIFHSGSSTGASVQITGSNFTNVAVTNVVMADGDNFCVQLSSSSGAATTAILVMLYMSSI